MTESRTRRFSERGFHAWARRHLPAGTIGPLPLGDDVAAIPFGRTFALLTSDAFVEGTHFLPRSPPEAVGRAVASASLSDVAAKGGTPVALVLDLLLPRATAAEWPRRVALGAEAAMARAGAHLVGGDTKGSPTRSVIGTVLAVAHPRGLVPRSAGRAGDLLVTTGTVGRGGRAGLSLGGRRAPRRADLLALLDIRPRLAEGNALVRHVRAMLDTSDGIAESCHLLAEASGVRVVLDAGSIPWDPALLRRVADPSERAAVGFFGGDYELLASLPTDHLAAAARAVRAVGGRLTVVGSLERGSGAVLRDADGRTGRLPRAGWDPFARSRP